MVSSPAHLLDKMLDPLDLGDISRDRDSFGPWLEVGQGVEFLDGGFAGGGLARRNVDLGCAGLEETNG